MSSYEDNGANNYYNDSGVKKLISGGDFTVYAGDSIWVAGYEENIHSFIRGNNVCDGFLADTIDDSICNNPVTTSINGHFVWSWYSNWFKDFSANETAVFQAAVDEALNIGLPLSVSDRKSELLEAAERYIWLMEK